MVQQDHSSRALVCSPTTRRRASLRRCDERKPTLFTCLQLFIFLLPLPVGSKAMMCGVPGRADNDTQMALYSAAVYNPGQKAEYSCQPGLTLLGESIRTCQNDGSWSATRPRCANNLAYQKPVASSRVVNHYQPDLIVDGNTRSCIYLDTRIEDRFIQIDLGRNYLISGLVIYVPDGYVQELTVFIAEKLESASGIQYRRCTPNRSRINAPKMQIECQGDIDVPAAIPGRFLHIRDERKVHDFYFALCEIEIYSLPDAPRSCGVPDQPAFAVPVNTTQLQDAMQRNTFEVICQTGFILSGPKFLRCVDGDWIGSDVPKCLPVQCPHLVPLMNGQIESFPVRGLSNNSFNTVARHHCSEGYMIFGGDVTRTCGQDGRWTGTPPFCRPTDCQLPRPISNAVYKLVDNHTKPGAIAQYTCSSGYVPQRVLADKPLQTAVVCQRTGVWKEGNFYCALRTTYYPPVSTSLSTTEKPSELENETELSATSVTTILPEETSLYQDFDTIRPVLSSSELEEPDPTYARPNIFNDVAESTTENTRSTGVAIAATGFVAAFILVLMVIVGIALNICRMRAAFDRVKTRLLLVSTNLWLQTDSTTKDGVRNLAGNKSRDKDCFTEMQVTVKMETEPIYNNLDNSTCTSFREAHFLMPSPSCPQNSEEESTYLDIDLGNVGTSLEKSTVPLNDFFQNVSVIPETKATLTPDEIVLLYAKIDKTKKKKNQVVANHRMPLDTLSKNGEVIGEMGRNSVNERIINRVIENNGKYVSSTQDKISSLKFGDLHPKKVNDLQLPKTVVDVSLNELSIEHSHICNKDKHTIKALESRPLPALPRTRADKEIFQKREDSGNHIYATLPHNKS